MPPLLIPRFETEYLVSLIVESVTRRFAAGHQLTIVDFGCGVGTICLSLLQELQPKYNVKVIGVDISHKCLKYTL